MTEAGGRSKITSQPPDQSNVDRSIATLHRLLIESVVDYAIFVLDTSGRVLSWNPGAQRLKGYTADEIIGEHFSIFYPPEDIAAQTPERQLRLALREGRLEDDGWRVRKDGSRFWANVVITALRDPSGDVVGVAKVTRDLTARREAEEASRRQAAADAAREETERRSNELADLNEQLQKQAAEIEAQMEEAQELTEEVEQSNEQLNEALTTAEHARAEADAANRAKADFLRTMSHELRTPINAVNGYVQLLEMGVPDPPTSAQSGHLQRIRGAQRYLLSLVDNVLSFARIEAGQMEYLIQTVSVLDLWNAVEPLVTPQMRAKGLGYHVGPCQPTTFVLADREKTVQILLNLVGNALKFTNAGGHIWLETEVRPADVALHVRDTGVGIESDKLSVIFEPFVQAAAARSAGQGGVGLGLAIGRQLARKMSGDITVESIPGLGSRFTLNLPRVKPAS